MGTGSLAQEHTAEVTGITVLVTSLLLTFLTLPGDFGCDCAQLGQKHTAMLLYFTVSSACLQ